MSTDSFASYFDEAQSGNRVAFSKLLTEAENNPSVDSLIFPLIGHSYVTGFTGAPGVGKSTLIAKLVSEVTKEGKMGWIAVDPTSPTSGGALLGDRIRMEDEVDSDQLFMRSLASRGDIGGLSQGARRVLRVFDAFEFANVILETVGVGQVSLDIADVVDTVVTVVSPDIGDVVQANKAGLIEVTDIFVINDHGYSSTEVMKHDLSDAVKDSPKNPKVLVASAKSGEAVTEVWSAVVEHRKSQESSGELTAKRERRVLPEAKRLLEERLDIAVEEILRDPKTSSEIIGQNSNPLEIADRLGTKVSKRLSENG